MSLLKNTFRTALNFGSIVFYLLVAVADSPGSSSWRPFFEVTKNQRFYQRHKCSRSATCSTSSASHVNYIWLFTHLYVYPLFYHTSVDGAHQHQIWMASACQGFGAQHDVASCRKRESRGKAKQDIFRSIRGAAPLLLSALGGKRTKGSALSLLLSPLFCPGPALPSLGRVLPCNTPLFLRETESNSDGGHLTWSAFLTGTCFSQLIHHHYSTAFCYSSYFVWKSTVIRITFHTITNGTFAHLKMQYVALLTPVHDCHIDSYVKT